MCRRLDPAWNVVVDPGSMPQALLLASRVATMLGEVAVPQALEALATHVPDRGTRARLETPPAAPPFGAMQLARSMHRDAQAMLAAYVLQQGTGIAMRLTAELWGSAVRAPGAPSALSSVSLQGQLQAALGRCEQEVVQLIDDGGRQGVVDNGQVHHPRCECAQNAVNGELHMAQER